MLTAGYLLQHRSGICCVCEANPDMRDQTEHPGLLVVRLVTDAPTSYILLGHTLAELHATLPPGLERSERQPSDPPEVLEVWFPK